MGLASARSDVSGINQRYFSILLMLEAVILGVVPTFFILCILSQIVRVVIFLWKATRARWLSVQGGDESQPPPPLSS